MVQRKLTIAVRLVLSVLLAGCLAVSALAAGAPLPIVEEATASSAAEFFSADYKHLPNDPTKPLYVRTGGTVIVEGGTITLQGGRFTVGMPEGRANTSSSDTEAGGTLDLSRPYRITLEVVDVQKGSGNTKLQVYVDNNTTGAANSIHASQGSTASRLYSEDVGTIRPGQTIVITSSLGTPNSFIQLRTESAATVTISSFKIEYQ